MNNETQTWDTKFEAELAQAPPPEAVSEIEVQERDGSKKKLPSLSVTYIITTMNRIFGAKNWQQKAKPIGPFSMGESWLIGATVQVTVLGREIENFTFRDVPKSGGAQNVADELAAMPAFALKRAVRQLGPALGLGLSLPGDNGDGPGAQSSTPQAAAAPPQAAAAPQAAQQPPAGVQQQPQTAAPPQRRHSGERGRGAAQPAATAAPPAEAGDGAAASEDDRGKLQASIWSLMVKGEAENASGALAALCEDEFGQRTMGQITVQQLQQLLAIVEKKYGNGA